MIENERIRQYIYIVQASLEPSKCKIGKTNDLDRRLKEYNNITGKSKENIYQYLFTCEVQDMSVVEYDIKENFGYLREEKSREIYLYNSALLKMYTEFIRLHKMFIKEIFIKTEDKKEIVKIIKKTTPSLKERGISRKDVMQKAQKQKMMNFILDMKILKKKYQCMIRIYGKINAYFVIVMMLLTLMKEIHLHFLYILCETSKSLA